MSKKYKESMDKIVLSDELKSKIITNAATNHFPAKQKPKHSKVFYFRCGAGYAACLALCLLAAFVARDLTETDRIPSVTSVPKYVSPAPETSDTYSFTQPPADIPDENNVEEKQTPSPTTALNGSLNIVSPHRTEQQITGSPIPTETNAPVLAENHTVNEEKTPETSSPGGENEMVGLPTNPSTDWSSLSDVREQLGYDFKVPQYLPEGYELDTITLMFGSLIQISYQSKNDVIVYRTEQTDSDISGDFNVYEKVETEQLNNIDTTLKSSGEWYYAAVWNDGTSSYSINSENGLDKEVLVKMVESTAYPAEQEENTANNQTEEFCEDDKENSENAETMDIMD